MITVYKLTSEQNGFDQTLPEILQRSTKELQGHSKKLFNERVNKDIGKYSFKNRVVKI